MQAKDAGQPTNIVNYFNPLAGPVPLPAYIYVGGPQSRTVSGVPSDWLGFQA